MKVLSSKWWFLTAAIIVVCIMAAWAVWRIENSRSTAKLYRAENALRQEMARALPMGSEKALVEEFLKAHKIASDGYRLVGQDYKASYKGASGIIVASTGDIETPMRICRIVLTFRFDDAGKLDGYDDRFVCNGAI